MYEQVEQLKHYLRMVWRHRWVALLGAGLVCAAGWTSVLLMPNKYEVEAKIFLDTRTLLKPLLKGIAVDSDVAVDAAHMMRRRLLVRPNLEKVVRKTDMDLKAKTPKQLEQLLVSLAQRIEVSGTQRDNIFVISYRDTDPKLATRVVEAILNLFVERSLGETRRDTAQTREFLERQIAEHEARLDDAEARLKEFKRQNVGMMPSQGQTYYSRLEAIQGQKAAAELALNEARNKVAAIERQLAREQPTLRQSLERPNENGMTGPVTPFDERIAAMERSLDNLLLQYTDEHPDVISTRRLIDELTTKREEFIAGLAKQPGQEGGSGTITRVMENAVYQELVLAHAEAIAEVAGLETRLAEYERRADELAKLVDTVPRVEAEFAKLNRDYDVVKQNYDKLVARLESLRISDQAGQTTDNVQFNVIDPPRVPIVPVSPDREKLSLAVLFVGIGAGIGLAFLLALLRPAVYTKDGFRELTDFPVYGVVSRLWTRRERLRRQMEVASFAVGCMVLVAVFAGLMTLYSLNLEIDLMTRLERLGQRYL